MAFTSVLPVSPGIGAECFLLEKQEIKAVSEKPKAHFCFPSAALCSPGPRGEDAVRGLGLAGALQSPRRPARRETWTAFVICSEANISTALRCGTWTSLRDGSGRRVAQPLEARLSLLGSSGELPAHARRNAFGPLTPQ